MQKKKLNLDIYGIHLLNLYKTVVSHLKRKGPSHLFYTSAGYREFALREIKDGCLFTFNDFNSFTQLSFPSLPQVSTSFSQPCLSKTPILLACELSAKEIRHFSCLIQVQTVPFDVSYYKHFWQGRPNRTVKQPIRIKHLMPLANKL